MSREASTDESPEQRCKSCGSVLGGSFCSQCGERRIDPTDYSVKRFVTHSFAAVTNLDAKFYKSFKLLFTRPGFLTDEYLQGRRRAYLKPIQMFLIANLIYFLIQPLTGFSGYNTPLRSQLSQQFYSHHMPLEEIVNARVAERGATFEQYEVAFNNRSSTYARSLLFLMIPLLALVLALLLRRPGTYFVEHLVFSTHFLAWKLLFVDTIFVVLYYPLQLLVLRSLIDAQALAEAAAANAALGILLWFLSEWPTLPLDVAYLYLAIRRFYRRRRSESLVKGFLLPWVIFVGIVLPYRILLFWVTFWTV